MKNNANTVFLYRLNKRGKKKFLDIFTEENGHTFYDISFHRFVIKLFCRKIELGNVLIVYNKYN